MGELRKTHKWKYTELNGGEEGSPVRFPDEFFLKKIFRFSVWFQFSPVNYGHTLEMIADGKQLSAPYRGFTKGGNTMRKKALTIIVALMLSGALCACGTDTTSTSGNQVGGTSNTTSSTSGSAEGTTDGSTSNASGGSSSSSTVEAATVSATVSATGKIDTTDLFSERDLTQTADTSEAKYITVSDGDKLTISEKGVYVLTGTASEYTVTVEAGDEDKVQIVLDGVSVTNSSKPVIYVKSADKVFITTTEGSTNTLSVTGTFTADGTTNTDAVIFSKSDVTLNGLGTLNINSSDNGVTSKDDLKVTGGTYNLSVSGSALEAHDSICVADGTINIEKCNDGLHAEDDDDDTTGFIYIKGGTLTINATDDGIHGTTVIQIDGGKIDITAAEGIEGTFIQINDGTINISASDDGINGAQKSNSYGTPEVEFNGGYTTIKMGQGDTDGVDCNGNITVNGGTIDVTGQSTFDYDGTGTVNGGTVIENGTETNTLSNQFMGGGGMGGHGGRGGQFNPFDGNDQNGQNGRDGQQFPGNIPGQDGQEMPEDFPEGLEKPENMPEMDGQEFPGNFPGQDGENGQKFPGNFPGGKNGQGGRHNKNTENSQDTQDGTTEEDSI